MPDWSRDTLWRQGQLLPEAALARLNLCDAETVKSCLGLVVSHDCDIANSADQEPSVEIIRGLCVSKADGNFTYAKNARRLHIEFLQGEAIVVGEFTATDKALVPKSVLVDYQPRTDLKLVPQNRSVLQSWLAARYRRAAFPDAFEKRLSDTGLKDRLGKILAASGPFIRAVFFDVDDGEDIARVREDDLYVLDVVLLYTTGDTDKAFQAASRAKETIEEAFAKRLHTEGQGWKFIELRSCMVMSDELMTVRQSSALKQWRLEYVSLREDPPQATVP